jgi:hypothetical protein
LFPLFATGVIFTGGKFVAGGNLPLALLAAVENLPPVSLTLVANLPPVSTTLAKLVQKLSPVLLIRVENLPPVSLIPVVHLDLQISPGIFEKILKGPNAILWGGGKLIHEKTRSKKSRDTVPLSDTVGRAVVIFSKHR